MRLVLFSFSIIVILSASYGQKLSCGDDELKKVDEKFSRMAIVASDRQFPTNDQELKKFCKENTELDRFVKSYTKQCVRGITKTLINALTFSISNTNKQICRNKRKGQQFTSMGDCGNQNRAGVKKCVQTVADSVVMIKKFNQSEFNLIIPYLCCHVQIAKECFQKQLRLVGPPKCDEDKIDILSNLFDKYVLDVMNFACSDYEDNDKCTGILKRFKSRKRLLKNEGPALSPILAGLDAVKFLETIEVSV